MPVAPGLALIASVVAGLATAHTLPSVGAWMHRPTSLLIGGAHLIESPATLIADVLMTAFFLVVGLEIRHELSYGIMRDARSRMLPVACALGGMVMPAIVFAIVAGGGTRRAGWAVPTATDVALAVGALALVAPWVGRGARTLLLSLAVADDFGGIAIICIWYSKGVRPLAIALVPLLLAAVHLAMRAGRLPLGSGLCSVVPIWLLLHAGGIGPSIAGALVGLAMLAGIGFTVPMFLASLAFGDPLATSSATLGVLIGSTGSFLSAFGLFTLVRRLQTRKASARLRP